MVEGGERAEDRVLSDTRRERRERGCESADRAHVARQGGKRVCTRALPRGATGACRGAKGGARGRAGRVLSGQHRSRQYNSAQWVTLAG